MASPLLVSGSPRCARCRPGHRLSACALLAEVPPRRSSVWLLIVLLRFPFADFLAVMRPVVQQRLDQQTVAGKLQFFERGCRLVQTPNVPNVVQHFPLLDAVAVHGRAQAAQGTDLASCG